MLFHEIKSGGAFKETIIHIVIDTNRKYIYEKFIHIMGSAVNCVSHAIFT